MTTKYIVNNSDSQDISGSISISGKALFLSTAPAGITGATGDMRGQLAFDDGYLYYCMDNFSVEEFVITSNGPEHIFNNNAGIGWNGYYGPPSGNYLQTGYVNTDNKGNESFAPQNGWYIVDDIGQIRQVIGGFWLSPEQPVPNGAGWLMTLDGNFTISPSRQSLTFYETLPTVSYSAGSGNIWRSVKLDEEKNTTGIYRALLTQTGSVTGTSLGDFNQGLISGETYTIKNYVEGDDFSNIANVVSGNINETGCEFIATGEIPNIYTYGSELSSDGGLIVDVLENSLGYNIDWAWTPFGGSGYYIANNATFNPNYQNVFPRSKVEVLSHLTTPFLWEGAFPILVSNPSSFMGKDNIISLNVFDPGTSNNVDNALYYTPIEIRHKKDNTPVIVSGTVASSYPINNLSLTFSVNGNSTQSIYTNIDGINDRDELVAALNNSNDFNFLGVFSAEGKEDVKISMKADIKNIFAEDRVLTFEIFND